jgi:hypothetical protein
VSPIVGVLKIESVPRRVSCIDTLATARGAD